MCLMHTDLPVPDGPRIIEIWLSGMPRFSPFRITLRPNAFFTSMNSIASVDPCSRWRPVCHWYGSFSPGPARRLSGMSLSAAGAPARRSPPRLVLAVGVLSASSASCAPSTSCVAALSACPSGPSGSSAAALSTSCAAPPPSSSLTASARAWSSAPTRGGGVPLHGVVLSRRARHRSSGRRRSHLGPGGIARASAADGRSRILSPEELGADHADQVHHHDVQHHRLGRGRAHPDWAAARRCSRSTGRPAR